MFTLRDMTTHELLNARNATRNCYQDDETVLVGTRFAPGGQSIGVWATLDQIIYALHGREHVPTKKEAKVIRQLQAKTHQSEEWLRAHPTYGQEIARAGNSPRREVSVQEYQWIVKMYGKQYASHNFKIEA